MATMTSELLWFWRYVPCVGVKLGFDEFSVYEKDGRAFVHLTRRDPKKKRQLLRKHIQEDPNRRFGYVSEIDFEIALRSVDDNGSFLLDYAHVFTFLLMIRTGGWVSAPVLLTHSALEEPIVDRPHVYCSEFLPSAPAFLGDFALTLEDAEWIKQHMDTALDLTRESKFQNAMQAMTSFHCIPFDNMQLVVAWSGLEALFGVDHEISFRLSLYIANFLESNDDRRFAFEKLRRSYDSRSRVAHGSPTSAKEVSSYALYTRDVLRACLARCIETKSFPNTKNLVF
jgi:hypothetical protein